MTNMPVEATLGCCARSAQCPHWGWAEGLPWKPTTLPKD